MNPTPTSTDDPDAQGLPPGVELPDAAGFKRDQLRARLVICAIALAVLAGMAWASEDHRRLYVICTLVVLAATIIGLVRYLLARRQARASHSTHSRDGL